MEKLRNYYAQRFVTKTIYSHYGKPKLSSLSSKANGSAIKLESTETEPRNRPPAQD